MTPLRKPTVYLETSTISYLTARPSENPILRGKQLLTGHWWATREQYELFISETVLEEIGFGDPTAAHLRKLAVAGIQVLSLTEDIEHIVDQLMSAGVFPVSVRADAHHVAFAAVYGMDFLLTWNQKHIATDMKRNEIERVITGMSLKLPRLLTPEHLLLTMGE